MSARSDADDISAEMLLRAYACGIFPMAEAADDPELFWVEPERRGVIPIDAFHVPKRLARTVRADIYDVEIDRDFDAVIAGCAAPAPGRRKTWINGRIRRLYADLFRLGHCHTVECRRDGVLLGGLYGVALGRAFFGESMFSRATDASKVALVHLVARLRVGGFVLLDTQFVTEHLKQFGAYEMSKRAYRHALDEALVGRGDFYRLGAGAAGVSGEVALQSVSQMS